MEHLPHGWSTWNARDILSYPVKSPFLVENEAEIVEAFKDSHRPVITCSYCGGRQQSRNPASAILWFHTHPCGVTEAIQALRAAA